MELNELFKFNPIAFCASLMSLFFFNSLIEELKSNEHVKLLIDYIYGLCVIYFFCRRVEENVVRANRVTPSRSKAAIQR